nr:CoA pyrophosphatase [Leptospira fluminis]
MIKLDLEELRQRLPLNRDGEDSTPPQNVAISSVIMPLFHDENGYGFLLQKRNSKLLAHPGQIAFPGGVKDPEDKDLLSTALREWTEEMGVPSDDLEVIGNYKGIYTHTGFHITPFLSLYNGNFEFSYNREEVEKIIRLDLNRLNEVPFYGLRMKRNPEGPPLDIYYFDLQEGLLWGATARILVSFLREHSNFEREPLLRNPNLSVPPFLDPKK